MAYIGSTPTSQNFTSGTDYFSGTGSQTAFTLTRTVNSVNDIEVVINNVVQQPSTAYTLSGTTITFTSAPSSGTNNIYVRYLATNMQSFTVPANSISRTHLDSNLQAGFQGRNKIINGHMIIDQRNAGASVTASTSAPYTVDRWYAQATQSSKYTVQQNAGSVTPPTGFTNYLGCTSSAATSLGATDYYCITQSIEGFNIADLNWGSASAKTITISAWVYSSLTGTFGGSLWTGVSGAYVPFSYSIASANTWTQISVTIAGPTIGSWNTTNGTGVSVNFSLGAGSTYSGGTAGTWSSTLYVQPSGCVNTISTSGATFYLTGVQLEEGTTATSFEREAYSVTLQKCQRYFYAVGGVLGITAGSTDVRMPSVFPVQMRATPTVTANTGTNIFNRFSAAPLTQSSSNATILDASNTSAVFRFQNFSGASTGDAGVVDSSSNNTSAVCYASAEL